MATSPDIVRTLREIPAVQKALVSVDTCWKHDLGTYVADLPPLGKHLGPKSIKDSVWGMIHLEGREILVVDSPMFQRLRRVKQLGTTYFTFPTADYSRFEHALGVMHQATRMVEAIRSRSTESERVVDAKASVRLACLLHDIGHLPLSHLSERHFSDHPDETISAAQEAIEEKLEINSQLSEILSFLLVQSQGFRTFLIERCKYTEVDVDGATLAILGSPPPERRFLKQLISNVIDADKLDYMFRDSRYTSVPLPVDLDRLLYKLKLLPENVKTEQGMPAGGFLAIDLGGAHLIEDLIIARRILARQIYRHHKTLAAEQLVLSLLELTMPPLLDIISRDDGYFVGDGTTGDSAIVAAAGDKIELAKTAIEELRFRRLPRRALARSFALLPRIPGKGKAEIDQSQRIAEMKLQEDLQLADIRRGLAEKTIARFNELASTIGRHTGEVTRIYFDGSIGPKAPNAELFIERPDGSVELYEPFPASAAAFAHSPEEFNYVFFSGKQDAAGLVHIAIESVLFDNYGLRYDRGSADHAKINFGDVEALKRMIELRLPDFFEARALLRPRNLFARDPQRATLIDKIHAKIRSYRDGISREEVLRFLDQFPESSVQAAVTALAQLQFIDNVAGARAVRAALAKAGVDSVPLVPLTDFGESSSSMAYHLRQQGSVVKLLNDAFAERATSIVLYEDSLLSGVQACSVLMSWFGKTVTSIDDAAKQLPGDVQEWMRSIEISFAFTVGTEAGATALESCAQSLGLKLRKDENGQAVIIRAVGNFLTLSDVNLSATPRATLTSFLSRVGKALLVSTRMSTNPEKWTAERCEERALGYSGDGGLAVFEGNTPTSTLTALWCTGGVFRGVPWQPLFPRIDPDTFGPPAPKKQAR